MRFRYSRIDGFTLVEVLVVMAIIVAMSAVIMPAVGGVRNRAREAQCVSNLTSIGRALQMYRIDFKGYPPMDDARYFNVSSAFPENGILVLGDPIALSRPPYIDKRNSFICPQDPGAANIKNPVEQIYCSYGYDRARILMAHKDPDPGSTDPRILVTCERHGKFQMQLLESGEVRKKYVGE